MPAKVSVFWFRRDLRLDDNQAFFHALKSGNAVLPIFIFDTDILDQLDQKDARVSLIYATLKKIDAILKSNGSSIRVLYGIPRDVLKELAEKHEIESVYFNKDYEPYALSRDEEVTRLLQSYNIKVHSYKDQVIFEKDEILKNDGSPYTVFTPYKNKWLAKFKTEGETNYYKSKQLLQNCLSEKFEFPNLESIGFTQSAMAIKSYNLDDLSNYHKARDYPALGKTSHLSPYLRFGMVSIRKLVKIALESNAAFLNELIWREFFMQILYHFPHVVTQNFKSKYDAVDWRNNREEFSKWCAGMTGFPLVDAGIRELNHTGYMHNRVRMVVAGFHCKHLLIDWRWGEAYFAEKLIDYELAANNGNWQWAAGTGCDAAPYFRIFNPISQAKKFDKDEIYIKKWVPEVGTPEYPKPIVDHKSARERCLKVYRDALL